MTEENKKNDIVFFAETNFRNQKVKFGIKKDDRRRHMYLIGKTGMGKSTAMENMIIQDIINGEGVGLVDPHGDLAEKILDYIPSSRVNDVVYLNPSDIEYPIAFNVMEAVSQEHKHLIASGLVGVFKKLWADSWGPRLEYVLRNAILALLDYPGSTLLGVMRILVDKTYRQKVIAKIKDPVVKSFWVDEYSKYPQQFQSEAIAPIQNKVGQFLSTALIRNVVGQVKSTIDLRKIMDEQKILIMNLSKGRIGEDSSALLGAMMITKIQLAAMSRIDIPESERKDFYLYVDEFQNFATESFANILSEARKYRLDLIIAHQYIEQLDELVSAAVFGNVGTLMCFRIGAADAEFLATEFAPYFTEEDLVNLTKFDTYMKLMINGVSSNPFSATTLMPLGEEYVTHNKDKVIKVSRERFAKPRAVVEDKISRWSGVMSDEEEEEERGNQTKKSSPVKTNPQRTYDKPTQNSRPQIKEKNTYKVNCYECGKPTTITFKPDGVRPIYCPNCFQKLREKIARGESMEITQAPAEEAKEISLAEAIRIKPKSFDAKKIEAEPKKIDDSKNRDQIPAPRPKETPLKTIKPGQVVRF
ncbi:MAG TPA: type IV secretion system DNA-binding domain-containing protein [Patescibacteria group bacterium]|nr:type IV secretion system DNA-binding domain-containing protein [Patescibacteria group bacterium]